MKRSRLFGLVLATLFTMTISTPASAYIDSGTGSMFLQAAISGILGAMFVFRSFWANLAARLHVKAKPSAASQDKHNGA